MKVSHIEFKKICVIVYILAAGPRQTDMTLKY